MRKKPWSSTKDLVHQIFVLVTIIPIGIFYWVRFKLTGKPAPFSEN